MAARLGTAEGLPDTGCTGRRGDPLVLRRGDGHEQGDAAHRQRLEHCRRLVGAALQKRLGDDVAIEGADTGLHLVARLPNLRAARLDALVAACGARGVSIYSEQNGIAVYAAPHARGRARRPVRLLLGYGFLEVDQIERGVRAIAAAYQEVTGSRR